MTAAKHPKFGYELTDEDTLLITETNPDFWTECSREHFETAVLDRLHLKKEWIKNMTVDGWLHKIFTALQLH